jgi:hypothetical protein
MYVTIYGRRILMTENYAKEFFLATTKEGEVWHEVVPLTLKPRCSCGKMFTWKSDLSKHIDESNPTSDNPRDILNRMKDFCDGEQFGDFIDIIGKWEGVTENGEVWYVNSEYVINPIYLLKKAVEFLKGEGNDRA